MKRRLFSLLLTGAMLLSMCPPGLALEAEAGGLCPHHQEHSFEVCGYVEAVEGQPCGHVHDGDCGFVEAAEEILCDMDCSETGEDGQIIHGEGCGYAPEAEGSPCQHEHDELCGYAEAVEGQLCGYVCRICPVQGMIDALPDAEDITADNRAEVEAQLDAIGKVWMELSDEEALQLDTVRLEAAQEALAAQDGQAAVDVPAPLAGETGDFTVTGGTLGTEYTYDADTKTLTISTSGTYTITGTGVVTTDKIVIADTVTVHVTLQNVNINVSKTINACAFEVAGNATCDLTLIGDNILKSGEQVAGLQVAVTDGKTASLTINENSTGNLTATGGKAGAGIGSGIHMTGGIIIINGGIINAIGGVGAAGIGSGTNAGFKSITINGGNITATSKKDQWGNAGAGIGSGYYNVQSDKGKIIINSGTVTAKGVGNRAAAIGNGAASTGCTFTTGQNGNAFIVASSENGAFISGSDNTTGWSGVIFQGNEGQVYGTPTLQEDVEITDDKELTIPVNSTLTIPNNVTLTNNGSIINNGTLTNNGTINGNGTITGSGSYSGKKIIPAVTAPAAVQDLTYTGVPQSLISVGSTNGGELQYSADNSIWATSIPTGVDAKDYTVYYKVVGNNYYNDVTAQSVDVMIAQKSITGADIALGDSLTYTGQEQKQTVTSVIIDGLTATYNVSGNERTNAGRQSLTVTGTGNFTGSQTKDFTIAQKSITGATVILGDSLTYTGQEQKQTVTSVIIDGLTATYNVSGNERTDAGTQALTVTGTGNFTGSQTKDFTIAQKSIAGATVTVSGNPTYTGQEIKPTVTVTVDGKHLGEATDYTVSYTDNTAVGDATATVTGKGNYTGTASTNFSIGKATPTVQVTVEMGGNTGARQAELTVTVTGVTSGAAPEGSVILTGSNSLNETLTLNDGTATHTWIGLAEGNYTVTAVYGGDQNYKEVTSEEITFNPSKQTQKQLTINPIGNKAYGDPSFELSTSGGSGTGAVTYESSDPSVISISGTTATIHKAGSVTITATKAEDENYNSATAMLSVTAGKKAVVFKANDKTVQQGGTMPAFDYAPVTLAQGDRVTTEPTAACTATDTNTTGTFPITFSGAVLTNGGSYEISYQPGTLTITAQSTYTMTVNGGTGGGEYAEGDTVTITATVPNGQRFTGWTVNEGGVTLDDASSATTTFTMPAQAVTVTANFQNNSSGGNSGSSGGGSYTPPTYPPTVEKPSEGGGAAAVSPSNPKPGDPVTVTPKPDDGYEVDEIIVTDKDGNPVEVTINPDGTCTFQQPKGKVTIEVRYKTVQPIETPWNSPFSDVSESDWYYEAVRFVQERGLMNGYSDGRFGANDPLSRAQLAQILFNKEGKPGVNYLLDFSDVADEAWYTEAIRWAASQGIVDGYGDGTFGPDDPITREQLAVILWRYSGSPAATSKELYFNDTDEISGYALEALRWAVENGILNGYGDGRLGPQGQATRAQVAQMLKNFIESQEKDA